MLEYFPDLKDKIFKSGHITIQDIDFLVSLCDFRGERSTSGLVHTLEPLLNYMIDNKDKYEWWML